MHHRNILYISKTARHRDHLRALTRFIDASALIASPDTFTQAIASDHDFDLVILDLAAITKEFLGSVEAYLSSNGTMPIIFIVDQSALGELHLPTQFKTDFLVSNCSEAEMEVRISQMLWSGEESTASDIVSIDNMTINLATYQVYVDDKPVDLTLMEYSLLSFLATHPSRAYSRDILLHRVWGFEYCGGTRTVDVHIRRVRSKVGPQIAAHIVTVRGIGYLFKL